VVVRRHPDVGQHGLRSEPANRVTQLIRIAHGGDDVDLPGVLEQLVRRHFEEVFNRRNLAVCDEIMATDFIENATAPFRGVCSRPGERSSGDAAHR